MIKHLGTTKIFTKRLVLRKFTENDVVSCFENFAADKKALAYVDCQINETLEDVRDFINEIIFRYDPLTYCFAIQIRDTDKVIGSFQITDIDDYLGKCEIGFILGSKYWNNGYMTEALEAVLKFLFKTMNMHRVEGYCQIENTSSETVMKKVGMVFEGIARKRILVNENYIDSKVYSILKEEYEEKKRD